MGLPVLLYIRSVIWRTVLQPIVEVSEVDSVVAAEVVDAVAVEAAVVEVVVEVEAKTKKNGFPLPSLADWSKMERSRAWSKLFQGSGYRHSWCHYLGKIIHHSSSKRFLG